MTGTEPVRLWSVTSLLKLGLGTSDALVNWAVNTTAEAAFDRHPILKQFVEDGDRDGAVDWLKRQRYQKSGVAAARGTDLHKAAEQLALGQEPTIEPENQGYLDQFMRFLEDHQPEYLLAECPVYSVRYGYAGTCDGVIVLGGKRLLLDTKTTQHGPDSGRSRPPYGETALQCAAYRHADEIGLIAERVELARGRYYAYRTDQQHEPMVETDGAVCLTVSPEDYVLTPLDAGADTFRFFRHVMECARWQVEASKQVFGPPIAPQAQEVAA